MSLKVNDVIKSYPGSEFRIQNINLEIEQGMFGLLGRNGAGKTSLMRILTTLLEPSSGQISLYGVEYGNKNNDTLRRMIGYLPQELGLYPELTVYETLDYFGILNKIPARKRKVSITDLLNEVNLFEDRFKKVKHLSGGMKRRVGLAQAMLHNPKMIVVDEPTAGLDPEERIRIRNLLVDFSKKSIVLLSTHIVEDIATTCTDLAILEKGQISYHGTVKQLIAEAEGKVRKATVQSMEELDLIRKKHTVLSNIHLKDGIEVRFISQDEPGFESVIESPNIEDAYILYTGGAVGA
ncbi:ATP-binding cassette domain-containing protein [Paenibacillus fonticola]|uniref:ATP-binding cassette domain-containing protein n=1 Tax=Paenibacillus fonticola TaxID=379896 RepID=UPI000381A300|nr:ATP-binding cassette domain-containing protein [Paenibacillus fonticola]